MTQPERRGVFDNDDLSNLLPSAVRNLTLGKRANAATADSLLSAPGVPKSAILSALAAFDSDDDERDDTYDAADVGGAVDLARADEESDEELGVWMAYQRAPADFARGARGSAARNALKEGTGWTDEALEGWAVMLNREPERLRRLERKFTEAVQTRPQVQLPRTSWRAGDEEAEGGRGRGGGRGGGRGRGRGRGEGRGEGRGGAGAMLGRGKAGGRGGRSMDEAGHGTGGPSNSGNGGAEQGGSGGGDGRGRARKEQNKGRVANHNRREGRARKMARGFAGVPA